ncbi:hypothetical protein, partial [uncultured Cellulomonas sp.]|uniref:hypothetical protein n=1 Tax=uncultured Cellulomonas sp. TaxID=189682 RepID=UPI0028EDBA32
RRRRQEERRHADLERARRDLPPRIAALLRGGVSQWRLRALLLAWRLRYRLRVLTMRGEGRSLSVVAANSPETDLVRSILKGWGEEVNRILRDVSESILADAEVRRLAQHIVDQRRAGRGSEEHPIEMPVGHGGAPAARDLRDMSIAGRGAEGTRKVVPGMPGITASQVERGRRYPQEEHYTFPGQQGMPVREVAAGSLHPGNIIVVGPGTYPTIAANTPEKVRLMQRAIFAMQAGNPPPAGLTPTELASAASLARLAQVESARSTSGLATENMGNLLAAQGHLPWEERYGPEQPMVVRGSGAVGRRAHGRLHPDSPETPGLGGVGTASAADVDVFLSRELVLVTRFLVAQMTAQRELYDNETALTQYVRKHLRDQLLHLLRSADRAGTVAGPGT